jgi:multidrug efflux system membrane fusion protein
VLKSVRVSGAVFVFLALAWGTSACSASAGSGSGGGGRGGRGRGDSGDVPVVTGKVTQKDVPVELGAIGNVEAFETISVRSQVTGVLNKVFFNEGDFVKAGDHLFIIDPRPYEATLKQAQANLARDQALLNQATAQLSRDAANAEYAQVQAERQSQLVDKGIISKDQAEQSRASADATAAGVKADRASIESAKAQVDAQQAAVDNARVQLEYTVIVAPLNGRTGNLTVKAGNLVTANNTELMTIAQIQPVFVTFAVPAVHLPEIKNRMAANQISVVATPQDLQAQPSTGRLTFFDNVVDPSTDTIKLKAAFDNSDLRLWPGQFARITLRLTILDHATVVPSEAVQTGQDGQFVFVVKPDSTVEQRPVTTGERAGQDTVIQKGLQAGETVVTEGQLRLEDGTRISSGPGRGRDGSAGRGRGARGGSGPGGRGQ